MGCNRQANCLRCLTASLASWDRLTLPLKQSKEKKENITTTHLFFFKIMFLAFMPLFDSECSETGNREGERGRHAAMVPGLGIEPWTLLCGMCPNHLANRTPTTTHL